MSRYAWSLVLSLLLPVTAVATRAPSSENLPPVTRAPSPEKMPAITRMCQTYRFRNGVAIKVGKPHPCKDNRKQLALGWNLRGGAVLPQ